MALCIEETNAHRRVALNLLRLSGPERKWMLFYFMVATTLISFFISDAATTTVMLLIAKAIMEAIVGDKTRRDDREISLCDIPQEDRGFCKALVLSSAYSSLIGGTGILTSSPVNMMLNTLLSAYYPNYEGITYIRWLIFSVPFIPIYIAAAYVIILCICMGPKALLTTGNDKLSSFKIKEDTANNKITERIRELHAELGPFTFGELSVFAWFGTLILLWIFRSPGFVKGWASFLPGEGKTISDASIAVFFVTIMFVWPKDPKNDPQLTPIMTWDTMKRKFIFGYIFYFGMTVVMVEGAKKTGLEQKAACFVEANIGDLSPLALQVIFFGGMCIFDEFALAPYIFFPIIFSISKKFNIHPLYIGLPGTLSLSYGFMLPTYFNLMIIRETNLVSTWDMCKVGAVVKLACFLISILNFNTYAFWVLNLNEVVPIVDGNATKCDF